MRYKLQYAVKGKHNATGCRTDEYLIKWKFDFKWTEEFGISCIAFNIVFNYYSMYCAYIMTDSVRSSHVICRFRIKIWMVLGWNWKFYVEDFCFNISSEFRWNSPISWTHLDKIGSLEQQTLLELSLELEKQTSLESLIRAL